ncbi:unnamed protein product [Ilex paraguariensis]|uniref:Protease Do-like 5, chloroplastic n=1 Tax=Ilex paraguariensis TaxID=185542 RepID=A0ABC8T5J5_9AQUA
MGVLGFLQFTPPQVPPHQTLSSSSSANCNKNLLTRRKAIIFSSSIVASYVHLYQNSTISSLHSAFAQQTEDLQQEEDRLVHVFEETSPSVVFIEDIELAKIPKSSTEAMQSEDDNAKVEGTGSGFIWDKFGHIVTNYHVIAKLATDRSGLQRCKILLVDASGNSFSREGKIIGFDPSYDLAVLKVLTQSLVAVICSSLLICKGILVASRFIEGLSTIDLLVAAEVDVGGHELKPVTLGISRDLRVGQSCFAIGNPYGYEDTLTTGVVSGLGREIPSPNGGAIRGAIQTDAAINAGS